MPCFRRRHRVPPPTGPESDPLHPWDEHDVLRREAAGAAASDAAAHGEDLLGRELPYADQVRTHAQSRLERLDVRRRAVLDDCKQDAERARRVFHAADERRAALAAALVLQNVDPAMHALPARPGGLARRLALMVRLVPAMPWDSCPGLLRRHRQALADCHDSRSQVAEALEHAQETEHRAAGVALAECALAPELFALYREHLLRNLPLESLADGAAPPNDCVTIDPPPWAHER